METKEIFKDIPGYEGIYQASNLGRIKSLERFDLLGRKKKNRILAHCVNKKNYANVTLFKDGKFKGWAVHRLILLTFSPNIENKETVNHINSNRQDNRLANLEWATWSENNKHAVDFGFNKKRFGENHNQHKLTLIQVNEIRTKYCKKIYTMKKLANEYLVSNSAIQAIIENKSWKM